jgi:hypothetical protein
VIVLRLEELKRELLNIAIAFVAVVILFKIVYYNESIMVVIRMVASLFWLFTLPGMAILYFWKEKLNVAIRILMGTVMGMATVGIASYYLGLIGLNLKYQTLVLPLAIIIAVAVILFKKKD